MSPALLNKLRERTNLVPHLTVVVFIVAAWGASLVNSLANWLGVSEGPLTGGATTVTGLWVDRVLVTLAVVALCCFAVGRRELGVDRPLDQLEGKRVWQDVIAWAVMALAFGAALRAAMEHLVGVPFDSPRDEFGPLLTFPYAITAGLVEELPVAAMVILMLRARWSIPAIYGTVVALRVVIHLYQGWAAVLPVAVWASALLWLYLRHRNVVALVFAHTAANAVSWCAQFANPNQI